MLLLCAASNIALEPAERLCPYFAHLPLPQTIADRHLPSQSMPACAQVSKQERSAHVVLCSSDYSVLAWLQDGELLARPLQSSLLKWCAFAAAQLGCLLQLPIRIPDCTC